MFEQPETKEELKESDQNPAEIHAERGYAKNYKQLMETPRTLEFFKSSRV